MTAPLHIGFERTLRLPDDGRSHPLPPGLGELPVRRMADLGDRAPAGWGADDLVLPLHDHEALFLTFSFSGNAWKPCAVKIGAGGVDAVSGASWDETLSGDPQDYLVCPPQPWLDGINSGDGTIRQFVAVPLGRGQTIEAQVTGAESVGGLHILVFEPKPGRFPDAPPRREPEEEMVLESLGLEGFSAAGPAEMGLGAGGAMRQKIYPDPYGPETWNTEPSLALRVRLVRARDWEALTGEPPPPTPVDAQLYTSLGLPWFELDDADRGDIAPSPVLARVQSIQSIQDTEGGKAVSTSDIVERTRRLLPDLKRVQEILRTTSPEELMKGTVSRGRAGAGGGAAEATTPGLEGFFPGEETPAASAGGGGLPQTGLVEKAIEAQREATIEAGKRGLERISEGGADTVLSPEEEVGLEAIVLLVGRPALLIQGGRFGAPPSDWTVLDEHRDDIEKTIRSVGRIEVEGHPNLQWVGTGFLVGPDVLMTNRHVAVEFTAPRGNGRWGIAPGMRPRVDFREEHGEMGSSEFRIKALIGIHGRYDMALFRLEKDSGLPDPLPLSAGPAPVAELPGRNLYVVGYPAWDGRRNDPEPMQRLFSNIYNVKRLQPGTLMRYLTGQNLFTHDCSTLGGNSGSCAVDLDTHRVIGLHFGGRYQQANNAVALWELRDDPLVKFAGLQFAA